MGDNSNKKPLSLKEGSVYLDGKQVMDSVSLKITFKPSVWEGKCLGDKGTNRRWTGYDIEVVISEYRTTPWYKECATKYMKDGLTQTFTITGTRTDKDSEYYEIAGSETVTVRGAVPKSDIDLISLDSGGDVVQDSITLGAKSAA